MGALAPLFFEIAAILAIKIIAGYLIYISAIIAANIFVKIIYIIDIYYFIFFLFRHKYPILILVVCGGR